MERASHIIAKIIDRAAFHPNPLVDMTARRQSAERRAWQILASSQLTDTSHIDDLQKEIEKLSEANDELEDKISELERERDEVTRAADKLQDEVDELNSIIEDKNETIKALEESYEELYNEVNSASAG